MRMTGAFSWSGDFLISATELFTTSFLQGKSPGNEVELFRVPLREKMSEKLAKRTTLKVA